MTKNLSLLHIKGKFQISKRPSIDTLSNDDDETKTLLMHTTISNVKDVVIRMTAPHNNLTFQTKIHYVIEDSVYGGHTGDKIIRYEYFYVNFFLNFHFNLFV